jgi:TRAP-type C4-dicarboxylate transport system permease small subunit
MVFLSLALPAKANRWTNIIVGILYIFVMLGSAIGVSWFYYIFGSIVEVVLFLLIVWYAWKWPKQERVEVTP